MVQVPQLHLQFQGKTYLAKDSSSPISCSRLECQLFRHRRRRRLRLGENLETLALKHVPTFDRLLRLRIGMKGQVRATSMKNEDADSIGIERQIVTGIVLTTLWIPSLNILHSTGAVIDAHLLVNNDRWLDLRQWDQARAVNSPEERISSILLAIRSVASENMIVPLVAM
jgi:hypothetical protein